MILELTKNDCVYLESLNLSYKQMLEFISIRTTENALAKSFLKYGIKHKTKYERIKINILKGGYIDKPTSLLAKKYDCNVKLIQRIKREYKNDKNKCIKI